jgi:hypothetical protein
MNFQAGDVVVLNSDPYGAKMTVETVDGDNITVVWLNTNHMKQIDVFKRAMLQVADIRPLMPSRG